MHQRLVFLLAGIVFSLPAAGFGGSGFLAPLPAHLTKPQKEAIFSHWTHFKQTDADQSYSVSASVVQEKLSVATASEEVFRSYTVKTESTYSVKVEDIISAKSFGRFVEIMARPNGASVHSVNQRIHDRTKTLLEDSRLEETKQCGEFSFSFEGSAQPEILALAAAEDINNYARSRKIHGQEPLVGKWEWGYYNGALAQWTTLDANGTATSTNNTHGHWRVLDELERIYEITWDVYGWVNVVHVSADHNALVENYYNRGRINSRQRAGNPPGEAASFMDTEWTTRNGTTFTFNADGTGTQEVNGRTAITHWRQGQYGLVIVDGDRDNRKAVWYFRFTGPKEGTFGPSPTEVDQVLTVK
jgi:hypothetical protein